MYRPIYGVINVLIKNEYKIMLHFNVDFFIIIII